MHSCPAFPLELVDHILGYLKDSQSTLSACALVSQRWSPFAQQHLFDSTKITRHNITRLSHAVSTNPHLQRYIRTLHVADYGSGMALSQAIPHLLVFQNCRLISSLELDGLESITPEMACFIQSAFPQITTLKCSNTLFQTGRQLAVFLSSFQSLKDLQLRNVDFFMTMGDFADPVSSRISAHLSVFKADMRYKYQVSWLNDWVTQQEPPLLHSLLLPRLPDAGRLSSQDSPVSPCVKSVQELEIQSCVMDSATISKDTSFNLQPYTQLRRLHLRQLNCSDIDFATSSKCTVLSRIVSGIESTCMQEIDLDLTAADGWDVDELDWAEMDRLLDAKRFSSLQHLNVTVQCGSSFFDFEPLIRGWLPRCEARGVLAVRAVKEIR
ncbi:hypothetical protein HGRIS_012474 [Hohenbuehelia grisea]|uniref:F-box domain-containing protein n=1 Tax=Hohenbuehelia grisea TaxID=104357 RepID=A0ABR3ISG2_9AGAR